MMGVWVDGCWDGVHVALKEMAFPMFIMVKRWAKGYCWTRQWLKMEKSVGWSGLEREIAWKGDELGLWCSLTRSVVFGVGVCTFYLYYSPVMNKDKGKLPFNKVICTTASQANKPVNLVKIDVIPMASSSVNDEKAISNPNLLLQSEKSKDWRFIKGEMHFYDQKNGWFEITLLHWGGGHLLLIKPWSLIFYPLTKPISCLNLWIRIFKLPNEYKNSEALSAILEANNFGRFIRMDPIHLKRKWVKFVRLCVNTDVEVTTDQKLIILDEHMVEHKYMSGLMIFLLVVEIVVKSIINHLLNTLLVMKVKDGPGWDLKRGITVVYESDGSSDQERIVNDEIEKVAKTQSDYVKGDVGLIPDYGHGLVTMNVDEETFHNLEESIPVPPPNDEALVGGQAGLSLEVVNLQLVNLEIIYEEAKHENNIPLFEEEDEDLSEDEEVDPEEMMFGNDFLINENPYFVDSIINNEIIFTTNDLEDYINEPDEEMLATNGFGNSFQIDAIIFLHG
ncbi:hypothetical protein V2J09_001056 [Rumex salicifolius]